MKQHENMKGADNSEQAGSEARRQFLKKAGKFAVYTPPAVMMLMKPSFAGNTQKGSWMGRPKNSWKPEQKHSWKPEQKHSWKPESGPSNKHS